MNRYDDSTGSIQRGAAMLVCDRCEGKKDVKRVRVIAATPNYPHDSCQANSVVEDNCDMCEGCRNILIDVVKQFFQPIVKQDPRASYDPKTDLHGKLYHKAFPE